jgi:tRNA (cmo5U34)-methyltransferase
MTIAGSREVTLRPLRAHRVALGKGNAAVDVGNNIMLTGDSWNFADSVESFEDHIAQSIPHCQEQREFIAGLARFFLHGNATAYEIGVATGALARAVLARVPQRDCRYIGLDRVPGMIERARRGLAGDPRFQAIEADALDFPFDNAALILSHYTLQFIPLPERAALLGRLHAVLRPGGALVIYEKTLGGDARVQDILTQMYFEFKARQGLSAEVIINKAHALQGVAMPISFEDNLRQLRAAGFTRIEVIYRAYAFVGFLAIKEPS